jgi:hypothetical protein
VVSPAERRPRHHLDADVAESGADRQRALAGLHRRLVVTQEPPLVRQGRQDSSEARPIIEIHRQALGFAQMIDHEAPFGEREERVVQLDADVDGLLDGLAGLGKIPGRDKGAFEMGAGITQRTARRGPGPRLAAEDERLVPQFGALGVVGESVDVFPQPVAVESLDLLDDPRVDGAPAVGSPRSGAPPPSSARGQDRGSFEPPRGRGRRAAPSSP